MTENAKPEGYSGTPLARKLGVSAGSRILSVGTPDQYKKLLAPVPPGVKFVTDVGPDTDIGHLFTTKRGELASQLAALVSAIRPDAVIWVSWPKKAAKVPTEVTEDIIREVALPLGLVDVKVCAIDERGPGSSSSSGKNSGRPEVGDADQDLNAPYGAFACEFVEERVPGPAGC